MLSFSPDAKPASIILLPVLLPVTFRNLPELQAFAPQLTAALTGPLTDDLRTQNCYLQKHLQGPTYREKLPKSSTYGQALNTSITHKHMNKLPVLLPVTFRNLPELQGNEDP